MTDQTSRPAAPESETPETDVFSNPSTEGDDDSYVTVENYNDLLKHSTKLERRLSLAQTEIKGHMRVVDELQVKIAELEKDNKLWHANWEAAHAEVQEARDFIVEQSKGNLGGGERPVEFLLASYKLMAHKQTQAKARIAELEKLFIGWDGYCWKDGKYIDDVQEFFDAALKSRA